MEILRTPEERFDRLADWPHEPRYVDVDGLRLHYVDEGPPDAAPVLLLHGEPTWSYLYRHLIAGLVERGHRAVALDYAGFGRSDKPARREDYSYQRHVDWTRGAIESLGLRAITLFGQDWGGLVGLRLAAEDADRFARIVAANTFLPTGDIDPPEAWFRFQRFSQEVEEFPVGWLVDRGCVRDLSEAEIAAYDAPFPEERFKVGARQFPMLVPIRPDDPASDANRRAWDALGKWEKPFLTLFGDSDPITRGGDRVFQSVVPGADGQPHRALERAGHFLQEDQGPALAQLVAEFIEATP